MSVEKEQFDKVMGELRRACLPAGGADVIQAYVDSLAGDLARAQASAATLAAAGRGAWVRADAVQAQLVEAVGLMEKSADLAGELGDYLVSLAKRHSGTELLDHERNLRAFLARHTPAEQQEAREPVLARPEHGVSLDEAMALTMDRYSGALDKLAVIEQQEPQGAQAVDEWAAFVVWSSRNRKYHTSGYNPHEDLWLAWQARAALATQPAVRGAEHE